MKKGYVYFTESVCDYFPDHIMILKIGKTGVRGSWNNLINKYDVGKLINRKKELQTASPFDLRYVALLKVGSNVERAERYIHANIHRLKYMKRHRGEWYEIDRNKFDDMLVDIRNMVNDSQSDNSNYVAIDDLGERIEYAKQKVREERKHRRDALKYYELTGNHPKWNKELKIFEYE